jgi:hypothetical protein
MRLGVPFIAPRQLGAVESISRRQFLPSVAWCTGQSGAPPDKVRCGSLSLFGEADRYSLGAVGAPDIVRCTPDSLVPLPTVGTCHASRADSVADRWLGRLLAHRTVRCTTGQSCAPPDSPLIYSRTPPLKSREQPVDSHRPGVPDTVRCTTGHCLVHHRTVRCTQTELSLAEQSHLFSTLNFSCFQHLDTIH